MNEFEKAAVRSALRKMFSEGGHFSICTFDELSKITGAIVPSRTRNTLTLLHCIDWRDMEPGQPQEVQRVVLEALSLQGFDYLEEEIRELESGVKKTGLLESMFKGSA